MKNRNDNICMDSVMKVPKITKKKLMKKKTMGQSKQFFVSMDFVIETFKYGDMIVFVLNIGIY